MRARVGDPTSEFIADWNFVPDTNEIVSIPGGNSFCSSHWDPERVDGGGIGEVRQLHYTLSKSAAPAFLTGKHHCGDDVYWRDGYPAGTPGLVYVAGIPTCCVPEAAEFNEDFDFSFFS